MRTLTSLIFTCGFLVAASFAAAQRPGDDREPLSSPPGGDLVARMMAFDSDKDGKLTKSEVTDLRLHRLFDRADANKDGIVTKEELVALEVKEQTKNRGGRPGFGGPPGGGPAGFMMGQPRPGEILPQMLQQRLRLTSEQKKQLADLQKEVDAKLATILTVEQNKQLKEMRERGPGRFGAPGGGPGRFGPPGGGPVRFRPPGGGPPGGPPWRGTFPWPRSTSVRT